MPIEGFDYKGLALSLAKQAEELLKQPNNAVTEQISPQDAKTIVDFVKKLCVMAGETLNNDPNIKFNAGQAGLIVQFVGEYIFHKYIDMINGKIPLQSRPAIMNVIAGQIFNTAKLAIIKKLPDNDLIKLIDEKVKMTYSSELQKLVKKGALSQEQYNIAINLSNLENMVQMNQEQEKIEKIQSKEPSQTAPNDKKVLKLASLAILLKKLPKEKAEAILNSLPKEDVMHIMNYMKMHDIENKIDHKLIIKSLGEIKQILPEPENVNVDKILKHYRKVLKFTRPDLLSDIAMYERDNVKDFILDSRFPATTVFSPFVLQSLAKIIEDKINDN